MESACVLTCGAGSLSCSDAAVLAAERGEEEAVLAWFEGGQVEEWLAGSTLPFVFAFMLLFTGEALLFAWRQPPYEYETVKLPIDILSGGTALREAIDAGLTLESLEQVTFIDNSQWESSIQDDRIYE